MKINSLIDENFDVTKNEFPISILCLILFHMDSCIDNEMSNIFRTPNLEISLEHILPQNLNNWIKEKENSYNDIQKFKDEYEEQIRKLGNLLILKNNINSKANNSVFKEKLEIYKKNSTSLFKNDNPNIDLSKHNEWNCDAIKNRTEALVKYLKENIFPDFIEYANSENK